VTGASSPLEFTAAPLHVSEANDDPAWLRNVKRDANRFGPFTHELLQQLGRIQRLPKCLHGRRASAGSFEE
jgi:hypothetical protein